MSTSSSKTPWQERTLGELLRVKHGYAFKGEYFSSSGSYIVLTPGNFYEEGGFKSKEDKEKYYTGEVPTGFILSEDDLIVAMTEQAEGLLGSSALVPQSNLYLHNQRLGLITELDRTKLDKFFLYYLFNSRSIRGQIRASANGTKVRHTSPERIYQVRVKLPEIRTQRKIASILSAYDRLIENNTRRIKILEEMARSLYDEWFVKFRFPGYEQTKMVDSELGMIPEGWEVKSIGEVIETVGGGTPSTKEKEYWENGDLLWYTPSDLTSTNSMFIAEPEKKITALGLQKSSARMFPSYSVMMTSRATIGVVALNTKEACTNQGFITCIPNNKLPAYQIYFWILNNKDKIISLASGATFKEINKTTFRSLPIIIVSDNTRESFIQILNPVCKQIENLQAKNKNLQQTRDFLLPKLISGEIDV